MKPLDEIGESLEHELHNLASPKRSTTFWGLVLTLLVTAALLWLKHGAWLAHPNDVMLGDGFDCFKNNATTAWHVRRDTSFVHYGGMNYPYGEHALFTDCQPIFSSALQWSNRHVSPIGDRSVGLLNLFQVFSIWLGSLFLFLLFRKLHFPVWYAGLLSVGMVFLTPQYMRFDGHFGLSHCFIVPAILYFLCKYEERVSRRYQSLYIGIIVWFSAQLHFYYFGMAVLFLSLYIAYQMLRERKWKNFRARGAHWVVMILLPFFALNIWLHWSDFALDRPSSPYGFSTYIGTWEGVFLPNEGWPEYNWIDKHITPIRKYEGEARAYAGVVLFAFCLWLLGRGLVRRVRNLLTVKPLRWWHFFPLLKLFPHKSWEHKAYHRTHRHFLRGIFVAGVFLMLFSCGFPYTLKGWEWVVDWMGPLKQFRGQARFTWVFFYVGNVVAFYLIWNHTREFLFWGKLVGRRRMLGAARNLVALLPAALLCWEGAYFQKVKQFGLPENPFRSEFLQNKADKAWLSKVNFDKFQALLPLPFYHLGSENIWLDGDFEHFKNAQLVGFQTGTPDMEVNMSRTSLSQTFKTLQLLLEPCEPPAILADLPDTRPLALFVKASAEREMREKHPHLFAKALPVYTGSDLRVLSLPLDSILAASRQRLVQIEREMSRSPLLPTARPEWKSSQADGLVFYNSLDSLTDCPFAFQGKGAFAGRLRDTTWIFRNSLPPGRYVASFWLRVVADMGANHISEFFEKSGTDGHEIQHQQDAMRAKLRSIVGEWALVELPFEVREQGSRLEFYLRRKEASDPFWFDEMLIRRQGADVWREEADWVVKNNFWYRK